MSLEATSPLVFGWRRHRLLTSGRVPALAPPASARAALLSLEASSMAAGAASSWATTSTVAILSLRHRKRAILACETVP